MCSLLRDRGAHLCVDVLQEESKHLATSKENKAGKSYPLRVALGMGRW